MKLHLAAVMMAGWLISGVSVAHAAEQTAQQQKMAQCNQHASTQNLKGDARKSFMSACLKKESKLSGMTPQQIKMKSCNTEAGAKKLNGDARKTFMSSCLKKA